MEKKHSEKEKTSLDSPSPKLNKSMIAYHETGDLFADTCEIVESAQSIVYNCFFICSANIIDVTS